MVENMDIIGSLIKFLKEVRVEIKKVNWLTREQLLNYTLMVIGFILAMAIFFGSVDYGFTFLLQKFVLGQ
jgi:preprotein translocase subunit SecE